MLALPLLSLSRALRCSVARPYIAMSQFLASSPGEIPSEINHTLRRQLLSTPAGGSRVWGRHASILSRYTFPSSPPPAPPVEKVNRPRRPPGDEQHEGERIAKRQGAQQSKDSSTESRATSSNKATRRSAEPIHQAARETAAGSKPHKQSQKEHHGRILAANQAEVQAFLRLDTSATEPTAIPPPPPPSAALPPAATSTTTSATPIASPARLTSRSCITVAVIGAPNVGKSTLVNALIGQKISAVSERPQTTRQHVLGVLTRGQSQVVCLILAFDIVGCGDTIQVFVDTPGVIPIEDIKGGGNISLECPGKLQLMAVVDTNESKVDGRVMQMLQRLREWKKTNRDKKVILVVNKADVASKRKVSDLVDKAFAASNASGGPSSTEAPTTTVYEANPIMFEAEYFVVSALQGGPAVEELKEFLVHQCGAYPGEWLYDSATVTNQSDAERVEEVIREQLYNRLYKELPYALKQRTQAVSELVNGDLSVTQEVLVPKISQMKIVLGSEGRMVKEIAEKAGEELSQMFRRKVNLRIVVKRQGPAYKTSSP